MQFLYNANIMICNW